MQTKPHLILCLSLLLLACQGPPGPAEPPQPTASPAAPAPTTVPSEPAPAEIPQPTPEPQPTPVQQVEVKDITPPEFLASDGHIRALTVDDHPTDPTIYVDYSGGEGVEAGIWQFQAGKPASLLVKSESSLSQSLLKYSKQSLYLMSYTEPRNCIKRFDLNSAAMASLPCISEEQPLRALAVDQNGSLYSFMPQPFGIVSTSYKFIKIAHSGSQQIDTIFVSQPIGPNKKLETIQPFLNGSRASCLGLCYLGKDMRFDGYWKDPENGMTYTVNDFFGPGVSIFQIPESIDPAEIPVNENGFIPFIQDGSADQATFFLPFERFQFDVDNQQNVYLKDYLPASSLLGEHYIRKISHDGHVSTLVSARGLKGNGYPTSDVSLSATLKSSSVAEILTPFDLEALSIESFVVDRSHNVMYIFGKYIFQLDLISNQLKVLNIAEEQLKRLSPYGVNSLSLGGDQNLYLYTTGAEDKSRIFKLRLSQASRSR